ncbi:hypothetical protein [Luteipulveratus halotolerans]|uniref:Permease n=1 Tax=Luteipulveratus halotolerans TaxID=1631356 RepID=A0A0L6CKC2_9MICO|nr:hypothetical protein [Luteipulveratus halotolerans]KNX38227.1 hypothetical protein VV01_15465 [Luteipulveratus halotolerans]
MPHAHSRALTPVAALATLVVSATLVLGGLASEDVTALALVFGALVLAVGWPRLLALPSARGVQVVLLLTALALAGVSVLGDDERGLRWLPTVLAAALIGSFLHQLVRPDGRPRLVATLAGTCLAIGLLGSGAFYLATMDEPMGAELLIACVVSCSIGVVVDLALVRSSTLSEWTLPVSMALSGVTAYVLAQVWDVRWSAMVLVAVVSPLVSHAVRRLLSFASTARDAAAQLSLGAASVLAAGIVAYAVAWFYR